MVETSNNEPTPSYKSDSPKITVGNFSEEQTGLSQSQQQFESKPITTIPYDQTVNGTSNKHSKIIFSLVTVIVIVAVLVGGLIYWSSDKSSKSTNNLPKVTQTTNQPSSTSTDTGSNTSETSNPYKNANVNNKVQQNEQYCSSDPLLC